MRNLHKTLIDLCAGLILVGCAGVGLGGDHVRWTEEVKLSDGRVIEIQRHVELTDSGFPVQQRGFNKFHEICYPPMGIHWKSMGGYLPDIFDIVDGKAYIHVPVSSQAECYQQGSPATGAIYFVWESGHWKRITHEEFPAASEWNLLLQVKGGHSKYDPKGKVTIEDKTTGEHNDLSLRLEQKRLGWKRVNNSYARRDGCKPYSNGPAGCADASCTRVIEGYTEPIGIFFSDTTNTCQR